MSNSEVYLHTDKGWWLFSRHHKSELQKRGIILYKTVTLGERVKIGNNTIIHEHTTIGDNVEIGSNSRIRGYVKIGDGVKIGDYTKIGTSVNIGHKAKINNYVTVKHSVTLETKAKVGNFAVIGSNTRIRSYVNIGELTEIKDLTKVNSSLLIRASRGDINYYKTNKKGVIHIGCRNFTIDVWLDGYEYIFKEEGYTEVQIREYGNIIKMLARYDKTEINEK